MKKILNIIIVFGVLFSGCKKEFLDKVSLSDISEDNFWQNKQDAELALMGCYDGLQDISLYKGNGKVSGAGISQFDVISDDSYFRYTWARLIPLSTGKYDPTSWGNDQMWAACYKVIVRANQIIKHVPEIESLNPEESLQIVAEAKVLRATMYNFLAMTYADVPLITEPPLRYEDTQVAKTPKNEIMKFVISELEFCYSDLPVEPENWGRLSRGAALGMLARTYLYNKEWDKAAETAQEVINLGYSLFEDYTSLFTPENEQCSEIIFPVTFANGMDGEGSRWMNYYSSRMYPHYKPALPNLIDEYYCTDGLPTSESPLFNPDSTWKNRDPRLMGTITSNGWPNNPARKQDAVGIYYPIKYAASPEIYEQNDDSPQDYYLIRYAHILLIKAEALAQQGTDLEIYSLINQLRDRVSMPHVEDVEGTGLSQEELLNLVKHERRIETAFEFLRYFDIKRWGEIQEKYTYYNEHEYDNYLGIPGNSYWSKMLERVWDPKYEKMPIPQAELDVNKALEQHEGY